MGSDLPKVTELVSGFIWQIFCPMLVSEVIEEEDKGKYTLSPWSLPSCGGERHSVNDQTNKVNHNCSQRYKEELRKGVYHGES